MNSKKFNFYKNSVYFYISSAVLLVIGLVIGLVFGFNSESTISSTAMLNVVWETLIVLAVLLIYASIRYDFYTAFSMALTLLHNVFLLVSLTVIFRVPVSETFTMAIMITEALTLLNQFVLFAGKTEFKSTQNREEMVNNMIYGKLKTLTLINCTCIVVVIAMIFTLSTSVVMLARVLLLGVIVNFYSTILLTGPFCGYFIKEKNKKKQVELEQDYVK